MQDINYALILTAAFLTMASPGPATVAIAGAAMGQGRPGSLSMAAGVLSGSLLWSASAALGVATVLLKHVWALEVLRYLGAAYLMYLALKSLRAAIAGDPLIVKPMKQQSLTTLYLKGLLIHLTNPKAVLFFAALYSTGTPSTAGAREMTFTVLGVGLVGAGVFFGYAYLFSSAAVGGVYLKFRRLIEGLFALIFGAASARLLAGARID
ncbi:MAG: LysE family translocator [Pseudomonadota bacterium]